MIEGATSQARAKKYFEGEQQGEASECQSADVGEALAAAECRLARPRIHRFGCNPGPMPLAWLF